MMAIAGICLSSCRQSFSPAPLPGKSTIEGVVLHTSDGTPVSHATILLCKDAVMFGGCVVQVGETHADADGRYSFRDIPPGEYVPGVRISKQSVFVMQRRSLWIGTPVTVKYTLTPGKTLMVPDFRLDSEPEESDELAGKLIYPVDSTSIGDPRPTLKWEPAPQAQYGIALRRVAENESTDIQLTNHPLELINTSSIAVRSDLEDGMYEWTVYVPVTDEKSGNIQGRKATAYFTIARGAQGR